MNNIFFVAFFFFSKEIFSFSTQIYRGWYSTIANNSSNRELESLAVLRQQRREPVDLQLYER